jgi:ABC-type dipeptide transport system, periplasmic component
MNYKFLIILAMLGLALLIAGTNIPEKTQNNYLRIAAGQEINGLNPFNPAFNDVYSQFVMSNIWEKLYRYTPDFLDNPAAKGSSDRRIFLWIAEEMPSYKKVGDNYEAIIKLRDNVYWWDGERLTADDVVFTSNLMLKFGIPPQNWVNWSITGDESYVESVQKLDDFTVKYTLKELVPIFETGALMGYIFPKHQWEPIIEKSIEKHHKGTDKISKDERILIASEIWSLNLGKDIKLDEIIGSGPFKPADWRKGEYMRLDANKDYWAKGRILEIDGREYEIGPYIDGILRKVYRSPDISKLAMRRGEVDITGILPSDISEFEKIETIKIEDYTANSLFYLGFNLRRKPMSYLSFRQAVSYLYDKELFNERIYHGRLPPINSVVPFVNDYWHNPNLSKYGEGMSTAEREYKVYIILKEDGFKWSKEPRFNIVDGEVIELREKGEGLMMPDGEVCPIVRLMGAPPEEIPDSAQANIMLQGWMIDIGIPAKYTPTEFATAVDKLSPIDGSEPDFDINTSVGWLTDPDPGYIKDLWHSTQMPEVTAGGNNYSGYNNPEFDELAEQSAREMNPEERREMIFKLQEMISKDLPVYPTNTVTRIQVYRADKFKDWFNRKMYGIGGCNNPYAYMIIKPIERE